MLVFQMIVKWHVECDSRTELTFFNFWEDILEMKMNRIKQIPNFWQIKFEGTSKQTRIYLNPEVKYRLDRCPRYFLLFDHGEIFHWSLKYNSVAHRYLNK